jgi:mono/diheme cytochrome c family protein
MAWSAQRVGRDFLVVVFVMVVLFAGLWTYLRYGHVPVAVADDAFPLEKKIVSLPLHARMGREFKAPPFGASEAVFVSGAKTYIEECAVCHGTPGNDSMYAKNMYPAPPQLWKKHGNSAVVGVSDDEPGETHWVIANGIRLTGMPTFKDDLDDQKIWQIALLLHNADKPMPSSVVKLLSGSATQ